MDNPRLKYEAAGWINLLYITLTVFILVTLFLQPKISGMLTTISFYLTPAFIYPMLVLKGLFNRKYHFRQADKLIYIYIVLSILMSVSSLYFPALVNFALLVIYGIVMFRLGRTLDLIHDDLYGYKKRLVLTFKVAGVLFVTVILGGLGIIATLFNAYFQTRLLFEQVAIMRDEPVEA